MLLLLPQTLYCSLLTAWHSEAGQAGLKSVMNATRKAVKPKVEALTALSTHIRQDGAKQSLCKALLVQSFLVLDQLDLGFVGICSMHILSSLCNIFFSLFENASCSL